MIVLFSFTTPRVYMYFWNSSFLEFLEAFDRSQQSMKSGEA